MFYTIIHCLPSRTMQTYTDPRPKLDGRTSSKVIQATNGLPTNLDTYKKCFYQSKPLTLCGYNVSTYRFYTSSINDGHTGTTFYIPIIEIMREICYSIVSKVCTRYVIQCTVRITTVSKFLFKNGKRSQSQR